MAIQRLNREAYDNLKRMNPSTLVHGLKSMWHLKHAIDQGYQSTPAMEFGSQYHCLILEPAAFEKSHAVMPDFKRDPKNVDGKGDPSTSANTTWCRRRKAQFISDCKAEGTDIITQDNYDKAQGMIEGIRRNPVAVDLLVRSENEMSVEGEIEGVPMKGRLDLLADGVIGDIKGTPSVADYAFGSSMSKLNTGFKMAVYRELVRQNRFDNFACQLIAIESQPPFDCVVYEVPPELLDQKLDDVRDVLTRYKRAKKADRWLGVQDGVSSPLPLFVPNYDMADEDALQWQEEVSQ